MPFINTAHFSSGAYLIASPLGQLKAETLLYLQRNPDKHFDNPKVQIKLLTQFCQSYGTIYVDGVKVNAHAILEREKDTFIDWEDDTLVPLSTSCYTPTSSSFTSTSSSSTSSSPSSASLSSAVIDKQLDMDNKIKLAMRAMGPTLLKIQQQADKHFPNPETVLPLVFEMSKFQTEIRVNGVLLDFAAIYEKEKRFHEETRRGKKRSRKCSNDNNDIKLNRTIGRMEQMTNDKFSEMDETIQREIKKAKRDSQSLVFLQQYRSALCAAHDDMKVYFEGELPKK